MVDAVGMGKPFFRTNSYAIRDNECDLVITKDTGDEYRWTFNRQHLGRVASRIWRTYGDRCQYAASGEQTICLQHFLAGHRVTFRDRNPWNCLDSNLMPLE